MNEIAVQDWQARIQASRELRDKLESQYTGKALDLDMIKVQAASTAQVHNAVINAALIKEVLGREVSELAIEGKLAAQFPASVIEVATLMTDKLVNMVGVDALLAIVNAAVAGKVDIDDED